MAYPISTISGSELILVNQDGQRAFITRPQATMIMALAGIKSPPVFSSVTSRTGTETIVAVQGGNRVEMSLSDFTTYLAATGTPDTVPAGKGLSYLTGTERFVLHQGTQIAAADILQFAYIRGNGGSLPGLGGDPALSGGGTIGPIAQALLLGDSYAVLGCSVESVSKGWTGYVPAYLQRINRILKPQAFWQFGWPGSTPQQYLTQLPNLLATKPNVMAIGDWVNWTTPGQGDSGTNAFSLHTAAITSAMQQFGAQPQAKEIHLYPTRIVESATTQVRTLQAQAKAWCKAQNGTIVGNALVRYIDLPDYDLSILKQDTVDGTHDTTRGAFFNRAKQLGDFTKTFLPTGRTLPVIGTAPTGNLISNPDFTTSVAVAATGAGAADVSGTKPTGWTVAKFIAAGNVTVTSAVAQNAWDIKLTGTMVATQGTNLQFTIPISGLTKFKRYQAYVAYELSANDGVSPCSQLYDFSVNIQNASGGTDGHGSLVGGAGAVDSGSGGLGMLGYGNIPSPQRPSASVFPINPETGVAEDIGEGWFVTNPVTLGTAVATLRFLLAPYAGSTVDVWVRIRAVYLVPLPDAAQAPFYQGKALTRSDGNVLRFGAVAGIYSVSGGLPVGPSSASTTSSITTAQANSVIAFYPGDFSGDSPTAPITYDGKVELSTDSGATWTTLVASLAAANWTYTPSGIVQGNQIRSTITATNSLGSDMAVEVVNVGA